MSMIAVCWFGLGPDPSLHQTPAACWVLRAVRQV